MRSRPRGAAEQRLDHAHVGRGIDRGVHRLLEPEAVVDRFRGRERDPQAQGPRDVIGIVDAVAGVVSGSPGGVPDQRCFELMEVVVCCPLTPRGH